MEQKFTGADYINAGTGVYSLVSGLLNRKPKRTGFQRVNLNIRPAQGDEEGLRRAQTEVAAQTSAATKDVTKIAGSDVHAGIAGRLGIQTNANRALIDAQSQNSKMLREDQARMSQELNQQEMTNNQIANEEIDRNNQVAEARYQQKGAQSREGINSSLNYIAQREANIHNNNIQQKQANERVNAVRGSLYQDAYVRAIAQGKDEASAVAIAQKAIAGFDARRSFVP